MPPTFDSQGNITLTTQNQETYSPQDIANQISGLQTQITNDQATLILWQQYQIESQQAIANAGIQKP